MHSLNGLMINCVCFCIRRHVFVWYTCLSVVDSAISVGPYHMVSLQVEHCCPVGYSFDLSTLLLTLPSRDYAACPCRYCIDLFKD